MTQATAVIPNTSENRKAIRWIVPLAGSLIVVGAWLGMKWMGGTSQPEAIGAVAVVAPMNLDIRIVKDGELAAVNNLDIICQVEGTNTIQQLVKEGTFVKKDEVLALLDSSQIKQKIEDTTLELQKATADLTTAREMQGIQKSQNDANLEAAQVALQLANLDFQQYVEGSYPQQLKNAQTDVEMGKITLKNRQEDLDQTRNLFTKGFVTAADVKKSELDVTTAQNGLDKAVTALAVLSRYSHEMDLASKKNAVAQAEQKLARVQKENTSNLAQKQADTAAKEQALALLKRRMDRLQDQLASCTIKAPADGLVVYASSGDRNADKPIAEGAQVRERQMLFRLPDTSSMKAVLRIQESQVGRLKEGLRASVKIANVSQPVPATLSKISVMSDSGQRWWNPDLKEYPVELTLESTPAGLKPGQGTTATVFIAQLENVLAIPLPTLYAVGQDTFVFVRSSGRITPVKVTLGQSNETQAEIKEGLTAGQEVLLLQNNQGRELLEKAGLGIGPAAKKQVVR